MSWTAVRAHAQPESSFLAHVYAHVFHCAVFQQVLTAFIDQELGMAQQIASVRDEPIGARAPGFLVTHRKKNDITVERNFFPFEHHHDN